MSNEELAQTVLQLEDLEEDVARYAEQLADLSGRMHRVETVLRKILVEGIPAAQGKERPG